MKGLIISSGEVGDYNLLNKLANEHDYIICADGGLDHISKINKVPDLVLGDLDSISDSGLEFIESKGIKVERHPPMKNETDTELALVAMKNRGIKDITLIGVTGSRLDHTIANILLLKRLDSEGIRGKIINENNIIRYVKGNLKIFKVEDYYISIIPLSSEGIVLSLHGFLYPLDNEYIGFSSTKGISNRIIDDYASVEIHKGEAIVIESKD